MAVTIASLQLRMSEFTATPDAVVQAAIDDASTEVDPRVFGEKADQAITLLAAHKLAMSPYGQQARLAPKEQGKGTHGATTYGLEYDTLVAQCGGGFWVTGVAIP